MTEGTLDSGALVRVARMYYEDGLGQDEIARAFNKSRPTISRMLAAARDLGIVRITVFVPLARDTGLERELVDRLGLHDCRVISTIPGESAVDALGRAAAEYLPLVLRDGMTVGVSFGRSLAATAKYLEPERTVHLEVVSIIGALGNDDPATDGPDIARALAIAYDARCRYLHVPLLVDAVQTRDLLLRDRNVKSTLQVAASADIALVGIGTLDPADRSPLLEGLITDSEAATIRRAGGVGHLCGEHYDASGQRLSLEVNDRTIGIGLEGLKRLPRVVGVAGGFIKAPAILGAVRGGYVDTLITDDRAASRILQLVPSGSKDSAPSAPETAGTAASDPRRTRRRR